MHSAANDTFLLSSLILMKAHNKCNIINVIVICSLHCSEFIIIAMAVAIALAKLIRVKIIIIMTIVIIICNLLFILAWQHVSRPC